MFGARFPYFNMQEMNLDWILHRVAHCPEIINAPPLSDESMDGVTVILDSIQTQIPIGLSFVLMGDENTPFNKRTACMVFKMDSDNLIIMVMTFADGIGVNMNIKYEGEWGI